MAHYVNQLEDGTYQLPRKATGKIGYEARTPQVGGSLSQARVFNTNAAALNSLKHANLTGTTIEIKVTIKL